MNYQPPPPPPPPPAGGGVPPPWPPPVAPPPPRAGVLRQLASPPSPQVTTSPEVAGLSVSEQSRRRRGTASAAPEKTRMAAVIAGFMRGEPSTDKSPREVRWRQRRFPPRHVDTLVANMRGIVKSHERKRKPSRSCVAQSDELGAARRASQGRCRRGWPSGQSARFVLGRCSGPRAIAYRSCRPLRIWPDPRATSLSAGAVSVPSHFVGSLYVSAFSS